MERIDAMEEQKAVSAGETQGARRATGGFPARGDAERGRAADPEVPAKAKRRQFSGEYKRRIVREADAARDAAFESAQKYSDWKCVLAAPAQPATAKPAAKRPTP